MNAGPCHRSPEASDRQVEQMVLLEIVALHPDRLTPEELAVRLEDQPDRLAIIDAIDSLKRCGISQLSHLIGSWLSSQQTARHRKI